MSNKLIPFTLGILTVLGLSCATASQPETDSHCFTPPPRSVGPNFLGAEANRMVVGLGFVLDTVAKGDDQFEPELQSRARIVRVASLQALAQLLRMRLSDEGQQVADLIAQDMVKDSLDAINKAKVESAEPLPAP